MEVYVRDGKDLFISLAPGVNLLVFFFFLNEKFINNSALDKT